MSINNSIDSEARLELKHKLECLKLAVDYNYLLVSLGFDIERDSNKEIRCACIIHGGDNKSAFRFNKETGTWICFTNKCHESFSYDVIGLIMAVHKTNFMSAVHYLEGLVGAIGDFSKEFSKFKMNRETDRILRIVKKVDNKPPIVNEDSLNQFKPFRSLMFIKDGFKEATLDYFEVAGGYKDYNNIIRDIIPIRDEHGKLRAYSLRDTRDNNDIKDSSFKYKLTPGFDKDRTLYNLDKAREFCTNKPIIVVEGFKSVWRLYEYGIRNVVAIMGSFVTEYQRILLYANAPKGVVLFFDGDKAGVEGTIASFNELNGNIKPLIPVFITESGMDPSDLSKDKIMSYLEGYF